MKRTAKTNFRVILILVVCCFCLFCIALVAKSGLFDGSSRTGQACILLQQTTGGEKQEDANAPAEKGAQLRAAEPVITFHADDSPAEAVTLGSLEHQRGFMFQVELNSKGASISKATFSEFNERGYKTKKPLEFISPIRQAGSREVLTMANTNFVFTKAGQQLPLDKLQWKSLGVERSEDGFQKARFEAVINTSAGQPVVKLIKTYGVIPGSYRLDCDLTVENLSSAEQKVRLDMTGPVGIGRESVRTDARRVIGGFRDSRGQVTSMSIDVNKLRKAKSADEARLYKADANSLWVAAVNKYFAAILVPLPEKGKNFCDWVIDRTGAYYNPDGDRSGDSGDETVGVNLRIASVTLAQAGLADSLKTYSFQLYFVPKDKQLFDKNEHYRNLGFAHTITFMPCFCCPAAIINPLAFGILATMGWMYKFIPNYGVVIIILVFLIRIAIHPLTKKSQVAMSKMGKLAPKAEEIKRKYANNKAEMNKQLMALYKEEGASPIMGMLPMMAQLPIWIALYGAIDSSIALRGAPFLPVWITDLSGPDALISFSAITIPLFGKLDSLNLLPILMGVAMYLQQKLTPQQATASASPQMAQQQKMMMIMMPLLFPLMLYNAPSGLNLYIMASTFAGVIEQYVIKKHIREKEEAEALGLVSVTSKTGGKLKKKKPKPFYRF